jgi:hypothetical protein
MKQVAKRKTVAIPLKEEQSGYCAGSLAETMVRTQIYLTRQEHSFLLAEATRQDKPMSSIIRSYIDEKMTTEEEWENHPLLQPPAADTDWAREDGAINHDHYIYGGPKKYHKVKGKWVLAPMLK